MTERTPSPIERFPTEGEVVRLIERVAEGRGLTEAKRIEDSWGLNRLVFEGVDSEGDRILYDYQRGAVGMDTTFSAVIDVIFHNNEGTPCGGHNIANYEQGAWKINK